MTNKTKIMVGLGIAIALALAIGIGMSAAQRAKERKRQENLASGMGDDGKGGFNPRPYTDSLYFDCYQNSYCDKALYADLAKMPDEHIRKIFLDWGERYLNKKENEKRTLAQALKYAYSGTFQWNWSNHVAPLYERLVKLGLE